jgi:hypothetical protein
MSSTAADLTLLTHSCGLAVSFLVSQIMPFWTLTDLMRNSCYRKCCVDAVRVTLHVAIEAARVGRPVRIEVVCCNVEISDHLVDTTVLGHSVPVQYLGVAEQVCVLSCCDGGQVIEVVYVGLAMSDHSAGKSFSLLPAQRLSITMRGPMCRVRFRVHGC